ncbi:hypothetical protein V1508DRAFT_427956 [Lipomyces doorenjongii]|uniref:uncharacterized protein n=1 Tax=Lipomyces doorenjongii TaxID=383834 RepID=UPI0034CFF54A
MPSPDHNKHVTSSSMTLDPLRVLPPELFSQVADYVSYPSIMFLREVSKEWNNTISKLLSSCPECYSVLDFRSFPHGRITPNVLVQSIMKSQGRLRSILLHTSSPKLEKDDEISQWHHKWDKLFVLRSTALVFQRENPVGFFLRRSSDFDLSVPLLEGHDEYLRGIWDIMNNVREISVGPDLNELLDDLKLYQTEKSLRLLQNLEILHINMVSLVPLLLALDMTFLSFISLPNLRELHTDWWDDDLLEFSSVEQFASQQSVDANKRKSFFPNLRVLKMADMRSNSAGHSEKEDSRLSAKVLPVSFIALLRQRLPSLKVLDISNSITIE